MTVKGLRELVKRESSRPVTPLHEIEQWFEEVWKRPFSLMRPSFWGDTRFVEQLEVSPNVDIYEEGNEMVLKADLPGIKKDDIKIDITERMLTISGEKKREEKTKRDDYYRYERSFGSFVRRFDLPDGLDTEKIKAHFEDGVLVVRIPMTKEAEKIHKKIEIE